MVRFARNPDHDNWSYLSSSIASLSQFHNIKEVYKEDTAEHLLALLGTVGCHSTMTSRFWVTVDVR